MNYRLGYVCSKTDESAEFRSFEAVLPEPFHEQICERNGARQIASAYVRGIARSLSVRDHLLSTSRPSLASFESNE